MRIIVGAGKVKYDGWVSTQENELNLLSIEQWENLSKNDDIEAILAEHVWEHLSYEDGLKAAENCYKFLKPGGYVRCADIFISIHCNYSSDSNEILGVETWYNPSDDSSLTLSKYLQQALIDLDYTTNRGVKSYVPGEELAVLELNSTTSALVELGFLTNSSDEKYLTSDIGQANCANVLYKAIVEYRDDTNE